MTFLAPLLLVGLGALAIPVIVHLVQRERKRVVQFPSLMFLRKIPYQSVRRRAIRHWPLLALRCLAFVLIVLAFARPFAPSARLASDPAGGGREVVILLDRSQSMGYGDHWDRARAEASRVAQSLGPNDRATLVFFATDVEVSLRSTTERGAIAAAVTEAAVGGGATRYGPALRAAAGLVESSGLGRREVVLISDFQRTGWDRAQDVKLPAGTTVTPISVAEPDATNASVSGLTLDRDAQAGRERVTVTARLVNRGSTPLTDRDVTLDAGGRRLESRRVSIGPNAPAAVTFAPFVLPAGQMRVTVHLAPDRLPADDVSRAVVTAGGRIPVLIVESPNAAPDASLYLSRALAVGSVPGFVTEIRQADRVTPADVTAASVVVLNDTRPPSGPAARQLETSVRTGTGLLMALGERSAWPSDAPALLPGRIGGAVDRSGTRGGTLGFIDYSHPLFEIFSAPHSGDLTAARVFRYRALDTSSGVVARFDDGAVAVAERQVGEGFVLAWTSTLDSYWNDLALKPVFVPFVHQTLKHLARHVDLRSSYVVGEVVDPASLPPSVLRRRGSRVADLVALTPGGAHISLSRDDKPAPLTLQEPGFYEIRSAGSDEPAVVAVNVDPAESDLATFDPAELVGAVVTEAGSTSVSAARELTVEEQERRQALWWYLLAGGLLLLVVEAVVANRMPKIV